MSNAIGISRSTTLVSRNKATIFDELFDSYGSALHKYLSHKGLTGVWLAEKITPKGQKVKSAQEKISRWKREGTVPSKETRNLIHNILDVHIYQTGDGSWAIQRTDAAVPQVNETLRQYSIDELLKEERSRLGIEDIPDTERGRELQDMLDDAVSLLLKIRRSIEREKNRE